MGRVSGAQRALLACALLLAGGLAAGCHHTFPLHPGASAITRDGAVVYIVKRGDTLYSVGRRFGVDYRLLARRNHLRPPYTIYLGQRLYINRHAPRASALPVASRASRHDRKERRHASRPRHASGSRHAQSARSHGTRQTARPPRRHAASRSASSGRHPAATAPRHGNGHRGARNASVRLHWPVRGVITSPFGRRGSRLHDGIDIAAPAGTAVRAAADGEVVYADHRLSGYGNLIIVRHAGDMFTAYAHNQRNLVRKGQRVRAGEIIARVGKTGRASGPHLHFEVRRGTTPVDPLAYLPRR